MMSLLMSAAESRRFLFVIIVCTKFLLLFVSGREEAVQRGAADEVAGARLVPVNRGACFHPNTFLRCSGWLHHPDAFVH